MKKAAILLASILAGSAAHADTPRQGSSQPLIPASSTCWLVSYHYSSSGDGWGDGRSYIRNLKGGFPTISDVNDAMRKVSSAHGYTGAWPIAVSQVGCDGFDQDFRDEGD